MLTHGFRFLGDLKFFWTISLFLFTKGCSPFGAVFTTVYVA